ncbi:hypothetical protein SAMN02910447_03082 [Ruminococcus sp. YE71]|uniref:hypothetical protein n=1 Tax=unclassified Ruminococcus TaxID=2608920 RepID=UPI000881E2E0|nr:MULTISPECIES: hypothetical protein [unclassified Ruminococcus]SDA29745.1 hypothetical protein SAMN02910446_03153 [Ruminococcus sp. YE78]SFW48800.1 hypothetical protein SAMN02910447_03082 [Ruminococcus sp. YE71]
MKKTLLCVPLCLLCHVAVLAVCFGLLCAAAAVPDGKLTDSLRESSEKLAVHDPHEFTVSGLYSSAGDNYADAILLGLAANMTSEDIPRSVLDTKYYDDDFGPAVGIRATLDGKPANVDYTRYWHGSLVAVRPLLAVTDISGIRIIGAAVILLMLAADCAWLIYKRHTAACVILGVSAVLTQFWFALTTLEYMPVYIIMLGAVPLYVRFADNTRALAVISAGVGTLTAFADFLTAETLTLLVPLTAAFFVIAEKGERPDGKKSLAMLACCAVPWGASYLLTFAVKWAAASAVVGQDKSSAAFSAAGERFAGSVDGFDSPIELMFSALGANLSRLTYTSEKISITGVIVWAVLFAFVVTVLWRIDRKRHNLPTAAMTVIALLPLIRFCVLMNHSYLHNFFTYRALMPSIMAVIGMAWYRVGGTANKLKKKQKSKN